MGGLASDPAKQHGCCEAQCTDQLVHISKACCTLSHFWISLSQLLTRLVGQHMTTRLAMGLPPSTSLPELRRVHNRVMLCSVLPSPMSSARIAPMYHRHAWVILSTSIETKLSCCQKHCQAAVQLGPMSVASLSLPQHNRYNNALSGNLLAGHCCHDSKTHLAQHQI